MVLNEIFIDRDEIVIVTELIDSWEVPVLLVVYLEWNLGSGVSPVRKLWRLVFKNASKDAIFGQTAHHSSLLLSQLDQSHDVAIPYVGGTSQLVHANEVWGVGLGGYDFSDGVDNFTNK